MIKKLALLIFVFVGISSVAFSQDNNIKKFVGTWTGTYEGNGQTYTASVIFKEAGGKLTGMAESTEKPDGEPIVVENIEVKGNAIKFELMSVIKYDGILSEEKKCIEGTLLGMNGEAVKLNMALKEAPVTANNTSIFIGIWKATINESGNEKMFVLVLTSKEGRLSGTIEIPEQGTGLIPLDNIKIDGNKLSLELKPREHP